MPSPSVIRPLFSASQFPFLESKDALLFDASRNASASNWRAVNQDCSLSVFPGGTAPTLSNGAYTFDGAVSNANRLTEILSPPVRQTLPDASGSTTGKGFTCTGLAYAPNTDTLWFGNAADNTGIAPSLVQTDMDGRTVLSEILLKPIYPSIVSVQGVAYDTSDNTLWFCSYGENQVHHLTTAGVHIESISTGTNPNGIAYNPIADEIVVSLNGGTVTRYSASTLSSLGTLSSLPAGPEGLHYVDGVYYSNTGLSGQRSGSLSRLTSAGWFPLCYPSEADAIEHFVFLNGQLKLANDAYFHRTDGTNPELDQLLTYNKLRFMETCKTIDIVCVVNQVSTQAKTARITSTGNSVEDHGAGLFIPSNAPTTLRLFANTTVGTGQRSFFDVTVSTLLNKSVIRARVDLNTRLGTIAQNGAVITSSGSLSAVTGDMPKLPIAVANYTDISDRSANMNIWDLYVAYDRPEREAIQIESMFRNKHGL